LSPVGHPSPMQVVTPFLPGDSLLFAAGTLAALGHLGLAPLLGVFIAAATLGDAVNYAVGQFLGAFLAIVSWFFNPLNTCRLIAAATLGDAVNYAVGQCVSWHHTP